MVSPPTKVSTVVPGRLRGEKAEDRSLSGVDLAFKLHYVRGLYVFPSPPPLTMKKIKDPMFALLDRFVAAAGRVRRSVDGDDGTPYIKCNDAGVRIVEAFSDDTVEELLKKLNGDVDGTYYDDVAAGLCYDAVLGPDLAFSPLVFIQFTWLKCGGLSIGLSWAHILGGVSTASAFINTWAKLMAGHVPQEFMHVACPEKAQQVVVPGKKALSLKELESVGDHWLLNHKTQPNMTTHSFLVTSKQLEALRADAAISEFEILSAAIWKSLSRIRADDAPETSTVCRYDCRSPSEVSISTVEADPTELDVSELASEIAKAGSSENAAIDETVARSKGKVDFMVYGANLTFVDLGDVNIYGLELLGEKPGFANYTIQGVGEKGVVLVLPCSPHALDGRMVTVIFPRDQLVSLKTHLRQHFHIA